MTAAEIHAAMLPLVRTLIERGASAADLASYFVDAAKGMKTNAAFRLKGADLLAAIADE